MPAAHTPHRLSRRSLLLTGAMLAPLGLVSCESEGVTVDEEEPPPPVTVTVEELTGSSALASKLGVVREVWPVRATSRRPLSMLVGFELPGVRGVEACFPASPSMGEVFRDGAVVATAADGTLETARVYASAADGARYRTTMYSSQDLVTWSETTLGAAVHTAPRAAGGGLLVGQVERTLHVWDIAEDGTESSLEPLELPDGQRWRARGVARRGDLIVMLVEITVPEEPYVPHIIRSTDGGSTWAAPVALGEEDEVFDVASVQVHQESFVLIGDVEHSPDWAEGRTYTRPAAWSSSDGAAFVREEMPLPTWGWDGWTWSGRGAVDSGTPMDFVSWGIGGAALDAEGTSLHLSIHHHSDPRTVTRGADGIWSASERWGGAGDVIEYSVSSPEGALFVFPEKAVSARRIVEHQRNTWEQSVLRELAPRRDLTMARGQLGPLAGVMRWSSSSLPEDEGGELEISRGAKTFALDATSLRETVDLPRGAVDWLRPNLHALDDERTLLTGAEEDEDGSLSLRSMLLQEGEWIPTEGLDLAEVSVDSTRHQLSSIGGVLHFPFTVWGERADGSRCLLPVVFTSEDGLSWTELGRVDASACEGPDEAKGLHVNELVEVDGALIGIGAAVGEDGYFRAAVVLLGEEPWEVRTLEQSLTGSHLIEVQRRGDDVIVGYWWADSLEYGVLGADGAVNTEGVLWGPGDESRQVLDLGDGAMLAAGAARQTAAETEDIGTCLWASSDAGATWTQTMLPGLEGRLLDVEVLRDGEDAVVITGDATRPYGFRLVAPKQEILSPAG